MFGYCNGLDPATFDPLTVSSARFKLLHLCIDLLLFLAKFPEYLQVHGHLLNRRNVLVIGAAYLLRYQVIHSCRLCLLRQDQVFSQVVSVHSFT